MSLKDDSIYCSQLRLRVERVSTRAKRISNEADALYRLPEWKGNPFPSDVRGSLMTARAAAQAIITEIDYALGEIPAQVQP